MKFVQPIRDLEKINEIKEKLKSRNERDYMMFVIGIYSGLRISDILRLKVKDVKNVEFLTIVEKKTENTKKTKIEKRIFLNSSLKRELKNYIQNKTDEEYLIKSRNGKNKPISRTKAYLILRNIAAECGLKNIGTHTLRKTFGYHTYERTRDVAVLMKVFNHSSQSVTLRYIGKDQDEMDKVYRNLSYD